LNIKSFTFIVVELGHGASRLGELKVVESLDTLLVDQASLSIHEETLHGHLAAKLVQEFSSLESLLEGVRVVLIREDKSAL
jgi:hypothetical protein